MYTNEGFLLNSSFEMYINKSLAELIRQMNIGFSSTNEKHVATEEG